MRPIVINDRIFELLMSGMEDKVFMRADERNRELMRDAGMIDRHGNLTGEEKELLFRKGCQKDYPVMRADVRMSVKKGDGRWRTDPGAYYYVLKVQRAKIISRLDPEEVGKEDDVPIPVGSDANRTQKLVYIATVLSDWEQAVLLTDEQVEQIYDLLISQDTGTGL